MTNSNNRVCQKKKKKKIFKQNWTFFGLSEDYAGRTAASEQDLARLSLELLLHLKHIKCSIPPAKDSMVSLTFGESAGAN